MKLILTKTRKAVADYDLQMPILDKELSFAKTNSMCDEIILKMEKLGEAVGVAFGEDTKDRNNADTCRQCVRPGPSAAAPGFELSFVRKLLLKEDDDAIS